ncbi:MAG: hypothetical protein P8P70_03655 [Sulfitobacter sp.]|nr:hypothetical protein [Sulfitobacter sp.]
MTEYTLTYQLTPGLLGRAMMSWDAPQPGRAGKRRKFVIAIGLYVLLFIGALALLHYDILDADMLLAVCAGFAGALVLWFVFYRISTAKLIKLTSDGMARQGLVRAELAAEQVVFTTDTSVGRMDWLCLDAVTALSDATVLKSGGLVFALPDAALPAGTTPHAFRADLARWLNAAAAAAPPTPETER